MDYRSHCLLERICSILSLCLLFLSCQGCYPQGHADDKVTLGAKTYVCLTIGPLAWGNTSGTFVRTAAQFIADNRSSISIEEAWTSNLYANDTALKKFNIDSTTPGTGLGVSIESMGVSSSQKAYRYVTFSNHDDGSYKTVTFPLLMAIITVKRGVVVSISWDDTCKFCDAAHCDSNTFDYQGNVVSTRKSCFVDDTKCLPSSPTVQTNNNNVTTSTTVYTNMLCQLQVYVVWVGTDSNNLDFTSAATRFSRLSSQQLTTFTNYTQSISAVPSSSP